METKIKTNYVFSQSLQFNKSIINGQKTHQTVQSPKDIILLKNNTTTKMVNMSEIEIFFLKSINIMKYEKYLELQKCANKKDCRKLCKYIHLYLLGFRVGIHCINRRTYLYDLFLDFLYSIYSKGKKTIQFLKLLITI